MSKLINFRLNDKEYDQLNGLSKLWNLKQRELARKLFRDSLDLFEEISIQYALQKIEKERADPEKIAELLGMKYDELEKIAIERGLIDHLTDREVDDMYTGIQNAKKKYGWGKNAKSSS